MTATTTASTKVGTSTATATTMAIGTTMANGSGPGGTTGTAATATCERSSLPRASTTARAASCFTTTPTGSWLLMTSTTAAIGNGNAIAFMSTTTIITLDGISCSTRG